MLISATVDAGGATLVVDDDGRGFDTADLERQLAGGHLGLRSLGDLVADAGGTLTVRSAPGQGTRAEVSVPVAMIRVLLVDDHAIVRGGLRALLATTADLEVVGEAADGAEAVSLAAGLRPDVVLMDLSMPGVDGVDATAADAATQSRPHVLVLTSFGEQKLDRGGAGGRRRGLPAEAQRAGGDPGRHPRGDGRWVAAGPEGGSADTS